MKRKGKYRNPLKRIFLGGFILDGKNQEKSTIKRIKALEIVSGWEEELKNKNEVNSGIMELKEKNLEQKRIIHSLERTNEVRKLYEEN